MSGSVALNAENAISFPSGENETPGYPSWIPVCVTWRSPLPFGLTTYTLPFELNAISPFLPGNATAETPAARARPAAERTDRPMVTAASRHTPRRRDGEACIKPSVRVVPATNGYGGPKVIPRPDRRPTTDRATWSGFPFGRTTLRDSRPAQR